MTDKRLKRILLKINCLVHSLTSNLCICTKEFLGVMLHDHRYNWSIFAIFLFLWVFKKIGVSQEENEKRGAWVPCNSIVHCFLCGETHPFACVNWPWLGGTEQRLACSISQNILTTIRTSCCSTLQPLEQFKEIKQAESNFSSKRCLKFFISRFSFLLLGSSITRRLLWWALRCIVRVFGHQYSYQRFY